MKIGLVGLGKMGFNLALNLMDHGHEVVAYDITPENVNSISKKGATPAASLKSLVEKMSKKRVVWVMVPAGKAVDGVVGELGKYLDRDDIIIDGGNSFYKESMRRHEELKAKGLKFIDCGTSGGISGARAGACTMVGGDDDAVKFCEKIFTDISVPDGYLHTGKAGSGHFVKMVHNGIEYGMMQAIAEGFAVSDKSGFDLDFEKVAKVWGHGSVIRGWLMELMEEAFRKDKKLSSIKGVMHASGEGLWTIQTAMELGVPAPVIALSLIMRQRSKEEDPFAGKVVAALRAELADTLLKRCPSTFQLKSRWVPPTTSCSARQAPASLCRKP